jgi:hypothetical protein
MGRPIVRESATTKDDQNKQWSIIKYLGYKLVSSKVMPSLFLLLHGFLLNYYLIPLYRA